MSSGIHISLRVNRPTFTLDVDVDIPAQGLTAIYGPSGAGKTTLLRAIAGLEPATGKLTVMGNNWLDDNGSIAVHQRSAGYVFQEASLFAHLSVMDNLLYGYNRIGAADRFIHPEQIIELLGLTALLTRRPADLSGGERQRVSLGRALLRSPKLLLMDEPMSSLDVRHQRELFPFLQKLTTEFDLPIIYVSHSPREVARLADHIVLLDNGRVTACGPLNDILTRTDLPVARDPEAGVTINTTINSYDSEFGLTELGFSGGSLLTPGNVGEAGTQVRVRVMARDISLTLQRQQETSILNILPASVVELADTGEAQILIKLDCGGHPLLAHITKKSAATLQLTTGKLLFAQIKTVALLEN